MAQIIGWKSLRMAGVALLGMIAMTSLGCSLVKSSAKPSSSRIKMVDLHTVIGSFTMEGDDPLEKEKVEYLSTGKVQYDDFFRSAAQMRAGIIVSQVFADSLSSNLKKYARSHMAAEQADENAEDISDEQAVEILQEKRSELKKEEMTFLSNSVASAALLTAYLEKVASDSVSLAEQGAALSTSAKSDFTGRDAVRLPAVVDGVKESQENLQDVSIKAPELAETIARLSAAVSTML